MLQEIFLWMFVMDKSSSKPTVSDKVEELKAALGELKEQDTKLFNEYYLGHWLRAYKLDVNKTVEAIKKNLTWRKEKNIEELLDQDLPADLTTNFPMFIDGKGKPGNLVVYVQLGEVNIAGLCKKFGLERLVRHIAHISIIMEKMVFDWDNERQYGLDDVLPPEGRGFFGIYDAEGFGLGNATSVDASKMIEIPHRIITPILVSKGFDLVVIGGSEDGLQKYIYPVVESQQLKELQARAKKLIKDGQSSQR